MVAAGVRYERIGRAPRSAPALALPTYRAHSFERSASRVASSVL
jgi:hypothetical protein